MQTGSDWSHQHSCSAATKIAGLAVPPPLQERCMRCLEMGQNRISVSFIRYEIFFMGVTSGEWGVSIDLQLFFNALRHMIDNRVVYV